MRSPRYCRILDNDTLTKSTGGFPVGRNKTSPLEILPDSPNKPIIAKAVADLPEPDSPTIPRV